MRRPITLALALALGGAGAAVMQAAPAQADIEACAEIAVNVPNTPLVLDQRPCQVIGLASVPPPGIGEPGIPPVPVAVDAEPEPGLHLCLDVDANVPDTPVAYADGQCIDAPVPAPPPGVVPPLPPLYVPGIPPPIPPPIPPSIPGVGPLPIPPVPGVPIPPPLPV